MTSLDDAIQGLHELPPHWMVVPVDVNKHPLGGSGWPERAIRADEMIELLARGERMPPEFAGFGVLLGPRSGLIDLDGDGPNAEANYAMLVGDDALPCPGWRSMRGKHRLFQWDDRFSELLSSVVKIGDLEVRFGNEVLQSALPPLGGRQWLVLPSECPPPKLPDKAWQTILSQQRGSVGDGVIDPPPVATKADVQTCLEACLDLPVNDANDGSRRLLAVACRCREYGLSREQAVEVFHRVAEERPFPRRWTERDFLRRWRDSAKRATFGIIQLGEKIVQNLKVNGQPFGQADADNKPSGCPSAASPSATEGQPAANAFGPAVVCMADVEAKELPWLWANRFPLARLSVLAGKPGGGKSLLTIDIAARVTTGAPWPDGAPNGAPGDVLMLCAEDDPADTIRPRLDAAGADVSRVHILQGRHARGADGQSMVVPITLTDITMIAQVLERLPSCRVIIADPIGAFTPARIDSHRDNELRSLLGPLASVAARFGVAVILVAHTRKSSGLVADDQVLGSIGLTASARAVYHVMRDPNDAKVRLLLPGKANLACEQPGLSFSIVGSPPSVQWLGPVSVRADDVMIQLADGRRRPGPRGEAFDEATAWLRGALADGPRPAEELVSEWRDGHLGSEATLRRAKKAIGAVAFRPTNPGPWLWRLPESLPEEGGGEQMIKLDTGAQFEYLDHLPLNTGILHESRCSDGADDQIVSLRENLIICPDKPDSANLMPPKGLGGGGMDVDVNLLLDEIAWENG